jgi:hypothetical protein
VCIHREREDIVLSEKSQTEKERCSMPLLTCGISKRKEKVNYTEIENKTVVTVEQQGMQRYRSWIQSSR